MQRSYSWNKQHISIETVLVSAANFLSAPCYGFDGREGTITPRKF